MKTCKNLSNIFQVFSKLEQFEGHVYMTLEQIQPKSKRLF